VKSKNNSPPHSSKAVKTSLSARGCVMGPSSQTIFPGDATRANRG
jgi:hypothetical protein